MSLFGCSRGLATAHRRIPISGSRQRMPAKRRSDDDGVIPPARPVIRFPATGLEARESDHGPAGGRLQPFRPDSSRLCYTREPSWCLCRYSAHTEGIQPDSRVAAEARGGLGPARARPVPICAHRLQSRPRLVGNSITAGSKWCFSIGVPLKPPHRRICVRSQAVPRSRRKGGARTVVPSERSIAIPVGREHPRSAPVA